MKTQVLQSEQGVKSIKILATIVVFAILFFGIVLNEKYSSRDKLVQTPCPNFDGKAFLLNGGTLTPTNFDEVRYALVRDQLLCEGDLYG